MPNHAVGFNNIARDMFRRAIEASAPQLGVSGSEAVVDELHQARCYECDVLRANLAREVADYLAMVDSELRAVYFYNPEYAVGDYQSLYLEPFKSSALYLLAWTRRASTIPADMIDSLARGFDQERIRLLCADASSLCFGLDLTVVGDSQVKGRKGYAVVIDSLHARSIIVWPRDGT